MRVFRKSTTKPSISGGSSWGRGIVRAGKNRLGGKGYWRSDAEGRRVNGALDGVSGHQLRKGDGEDSEVEVELYRGRGVM